MTHFEDCLKRNGLGAMLEEEFGRWGHLTADAADMVLEVAVMETITPELLAYTWAKESCFVFSPMPNANNIPVNPYGFDVGPGQLNVAWCYKSIWVGEYSAKDLHYDQVFGKTFYVQHQTEMGPITQPCAFTGSPLANLRMASRRLLARKGDDEHRAVEYPGPLARPNRREGWKKYGHLLRDFFAAYSEGK